MNSDNQTRAFLLAHCQAYPRLELTDLFKALYQSACGCEHLVGDASAAAAYITDEAASCKPHSGAVIEPLDGRPFFSRTGQAVQVAFLLKERRSGLSRPVQFAVCPLNEGES